jgi:uncharacterized protein DUF1566
MRFLKVSALMAAMLFSAIAMLGVLSMRGLPARGGSIPGATTNGDVNCDGRVDLSDAISIIQYSFYGGTSPCALAQDNFATKDELAALAARVDWIANQAIPTPDRRSEGRFQDNGDGTVTDLLTGLQWQKSTGDIDHNGAINVQDAGSLAQVTTYLNGLSLGGKSDWRIPTLAELSSILDRSVVNPAIDSVFKETPNLSGYGYWTSSPVGESNDARFWINFSRGETHGDGIQGISAFIRAVRTP